MTGRNTALNSELFLEPNVKAGYASLSVSMSEFKKNPAAVLRESRNRPVAVLNHNRPARYMIELSCSKP